MDRTRLARHLVRAALAYHDAAPWQRFLSDELVAVRVPDQAMPVFASMIGASGGSHGLCVFRGPDAFAVCQRMLAGASFDEVTSASDTLTVAFLPPSFVPPEHATVLREAKFAGSIAPHFLTKAPGRGPRVTNTKENELLLFVLEGLLAAEAKGMLRPLPPSGRGSAAVWTLSLSGKPQAPELSARFEEYGASATQPASVALPDDVRELPKSGASWWIALAPMPAGVAQGDRELHALIVFDATAGEVLLMRATWRVDPVEVADALAEVGRVDDGQGPRGLPKHVDFDRQTLHEALATALADAGVSTGLVAELTEARSLIESFLGNRRGELEAAARDDDGPAEDDLAGWRQVDAQVSRLLGKQAMAGSAPGERAGPRYFGPRPQIHDLDHTAALACFSEWLACHWRSNARSQTAAERLLARGDLTGAAQGLLAARASAPVALYRLGAETPGQGLELTDVLHGTSVRVDLALSEFAGEGALLFGKVYPAGAFHLLSVLSVPLPADHERTLHWLGSQGLELTHEGLQRSSHLLGRLWALRAQTEATAPMQDTGGEGEASM